MNERTFVNGDGIARKVPLIMLMAASNEWPNDENGGKEMGAAFDRFLFRKKVLPIRSAVGMSRLRDFDGTANGHKPKFSSTIHRGELDQANAEAKALPFTSDAKEAFGHIIKDLAKDGISPGDRRQYKSVGACRAFAYLCGASEVDAEHLAILAHTLWDDPIEQPERVMRHVLKNACPMIQVVNDLLMTVEDVVSKSQPIEAIPKVQAIQKELKKVEDGPHKEKALAYVVNTLKELRDKVVGL